MHDIGKIGIPESILHKPGPLDNDEWIVMKRHPVISELILSEIDLSPIVLQIARSSGNCVMYFVSLHGHGTSA